MRKSSSSPATTSDVSRKSGYWLMRFADLVVLDHLQTIYLAMPQTSGTLRRGPQPMASGSGETAMPHSILHDEAPACTCGHSHPSLGLRLLHQAEQVVQRFPHHAPQGGSHCMHVLPALLPPQRLLHRGPACCGTRGAVSGRQGGGDAAAGPPPLPHHAEAGRWVATTTHSYRLGPKCVSWAAAQQQWPQVSSTGRVCPSVQEGLSVQAHMWVCCPSWR